MSDSVTVAIRRALVLWPDLVITRTAPFDTKRNKMGRFSWDVFVTYYPWKGKPNRIHTKARTLPLALAKVVKLGERIRAERTVKQRQTKARRKR